MQMIDIGGRRLAVEDTGAGGPPVILEGGLLSAGDDWQVVQQALTPVTRVCAYARAGRGQSDPAPLPRTFQDIVHDLHLLLGALAVEPPVIFVGASIGGMIGRVYAHLYPGEVAGMVLADPSHPDQFIRSTAALPSEQPGEDGGIRYFRSFWTEGHKDPSKNPEGIDFPVSCEQARQCGTLGDIPVTVLTSGTFLQMPFDAASQQRLHRVWLEMHEEIAALSTRSQRITIEDSGHFMAKDRPDAIIEAVRQMVAQVRG